MQAYAWDRDGFHQSYSKSYYKARGCGAAKNRHCGCNDSQVSYSRLFFEDDQLFKARAESIVQVLGLESGSDILVIGCALGFLMEELKQLGMNVWGCDNSQYIQSIKNKEKVGFPIHNISVLEDNFVSTVQSKTGALWFDVVITEDLLSSHDEHSKIFAHCEQLVNPNNPKNNIVHIVDVNVSAPFTSKTRDQWKELKPDHTWLDVVGKVL